MSLREFVGAMRACVPEEGRIMMCAFRGDPNSDIEGKWRARVLNDLSMIDEAANVYLCVSAMKRNGRGEFRRRKENFCGGLLLMIDDLGDGPGAKFPLSTIERVPPTAMIETSPSNFQAVYMFEELERDQARFEALINAFIKAQFLGKDTGMAGVNRVFRPPAGINGKPKHGGWRVRLAEWAPERRYSVLSLAEGFGLSLHRQGPRAPRGATEDKAENIRAFVEVRRVLRSASMLRREEANMAGWADIRCPWTDQHTGGVDNGAAIRLPDEENGWNGGFRCHHGACIDKKWRDLTQWIADSQEDILSAVNEAARDFSEYEVKP